VLAGAVAAVFGGSHVQVSGPTGAMTVVLIPLVSRYGSSVVYLLAVLAGSLLVVAALFRVGRLLAYVPWPLVEGFTVGIAVVIGAQEVPSALGVAKPDVDNAVAGAAVAVGRFVHHPHWASLGLLVVAVILTAWLPRFHRALPAGLIAVVATTVAARGFGASVALLGSLPASLPAPHLPGVADAPSLIGPALSVAFLAALESLLSAQVADGMSDRPRYDPHRELLGQGLANIASGIGGGMPATGAIARTAVNARAGAHTRIAALTHALVLAVIVFTLSPLVSQLPLVSLAGVLMVTAYRMVDKDAVRAVLTATKGDRLVLVVTAATTVAFDLVRAVVVGLVVAGVLALAHLARTVRTIAEPVSPEGLDDVTEHELVKRHVLVYRVDGPLFFAAATRFLNTFATTADVRVVILRLGSLDMLDATGARALTELVDELERRGITVLIKCFRPGHTRTLRQVRASRSSCPAEHLFSDLPAAMAHARMHLAVTSGRWG
jgi:SulP family sulfate permease